VSLGFENILTSRFGVRMKVRGVEECAGRDATGGGEEEQENLRFSCRSKQIARALFSIW
jgi:hypothetical protein